MSIYDGLCDVGSAVNNRCPNPATNYSNQYAWCDKDGHGASLGADTWPDVVKRFEARRQAIVAIIETAERDGMFLLHEDDVISPRQARCILSNGYTISSGLSLVNPQSYISSYQREAVEHMEARPPNVEPA